MNIMTGKSFRLAMLLAVGVLALLLATGTFSPQKAAAQQVDADSVEVHPETAAGGEVTPIRVTFDLTADILSGEEITITLEDFDIPAEIDPAHISIRSGSEAAQVGRPANVMVDEDSVTLEVGNDGDGVGMELAGEDNSVTFARAAGIKPPVPAGVYDVTVAAPTGVAVTAEMPFTVAATVKVTPEAGDSTTTFTVTGTSFTDGTVDIYVTSGTETFSVGTPDGNQLVEDGVRVSGGKFSLDVKIPTSNAGAIEPPFGNGTNTVHVIGDKVTGANDAAAEVMGEFAITGKVAVEVDDKAVDSLILGQQNVKVELTQGPAGTAVITEVTIGDVSVSISPTVETLRDTDPLNNSADEVELENNGVTFYMDVPAGAPSGEQTLTLIAPDNTNQPNDEGTDLDVLGSATVEIVALELELNPSTVVQGMTVRLTASGFGGDKDTKADSLKIDDDAAGATVFDDAGEGALSSGRYNFTFVVPDLAAGEATVTLIQDDGKIGTGKLTVSAPTIEIDPAESRVDTDVVVTGTGFPATDPIYIRYGEYDGVETANIQGRLVGVVNADSTGNWEHTIAVPTNASNGTNDMWAYRPEIIGTPTKLLRVAEAMEHTVPGGEISYSDSEGVAGDTITVSGEAYTPYTAVNITLGGANVGSGVTDHNGDFSIPIEIPIFRPGSFQTLTVTIGEDDATQAIETESIEILATAPEPESRAVTDVFAAEIASGNLIVAWRYDNDTEIWSYFDPNLDEADNNYTIAAAGDIVWLNLQAATTFQGKSLKGGWQLVTLQ